jgi:hypothetical protein
LKRGDPRRGLGLGLVNLLAERYSRHLGRSIDPLAEVAVTVGASQVGLGAGRIGKGECDAWRGGELKRGCGGVLGVVALCRAGRMVDLCDHP